VRADQLRELAETRLHDPQAIQRAADARKRADSPVGPSGKCFVIAADHPARGALKVGGDPMAMADRGDLLDRLRVALDNPGCSGVLATADILEDLLLLGALEGKAVFGSMNRGGLAGAGFEIDDRFTGMTAEGIERLGFDGGKTLTRIDLDDPATPAILEQTAKAVDDLAARGKVAMVEPFMSSRVEGRVVNDLRTEAVVRSVAIASGLGSTTAPPWLKLPPAPAQGAIAPLRRLRAGSVNRYRPATIAEPLHGAIDRGIWVIASRPDSENFIGIDLDDHCARDAFGISPVLGASQEQSSVPNADTAVLTSRCAPSRSPCSTGGWRATTPRPSCSARRSRPSCCSRPGCSCPGSPPSSCWWCRAAPRWRRCGRSCARGRWTPCRARADP
jgi:hypothetical protein